MHVLLSNDDGIEAQGLRVLRETLQEARPQWRITTIAPTNEQSATSHSLTLTRPLRVDEVRPREFAIDGTPTDCVLVGVNAILDDDLPDVIVSGINHGPNMGEDVHYSGTVAAAFEGRLNHLPSIALSLASKDKPYQFDACRAFVRDHLTRWIEEDLAVHSLLNVNIPATRASEVRGIVACALGNRRYENTITRKTDPRGRDYFWLGGQAVALDNARPNDFALCQEGWITVTPLRVDLTDAERLEELRHELEGLDGKSSEGRGE
jgi:5'-nucleotidase